MIWLSTLEPARNCNVNYGGQSRNRTYDVSNVPDLQSGAFANYAYLPIIDCLENHSHFRLPTIITTIAWTMRRQLPPFPTRLFSYWLVRSGREDVSHNGAAQGTWTPNICLEGRDVTVTPVLHKNEQSRHNLAHFILNFHSRNLVMTDNE